MKALERLIERISRQVNIHLRHLNFDVGPYLENIVPLKQFTKFYGFYGITAHHPIHFHFSNSSLAGTYLLGQCKVDNAVLYKSDIRGDELKCKGDGFKYQGNDIPLDRDEVIRISDSYLIKTLVHNYSHDPEDLENFNIRSSVAMPYANIHGAPVEGCFIGSFATADLTTLQKCVLGEYAYVQVGELTHTAVPPGLIWVRAPDLFEFRYQHDPAVLAHYITMPAGGRPGGRFIDFEEGVQDAFQPCFDQVCLIHDVKVSRWSSTSPYAMVKGSSVIGENVLVCQRAYLENARLGRGANAQEHCSIIDSELAGYNVTAHGGFIINCKMDEKIFVGFNAYLHGLKDAPLRVGRGCIVMPHTIIDLAEPVTIPPETLVWGHITRQKDVAENSIALKELSAVTSEIKVGEMVFKGSGAGFVKAFQYRIEHILEANGAYFDGKKGRGHAQKGQNIAFNIIQPYPMGTMKGIYPTMDINP
jgi:carbonic anhydrase/acetyltransferase-like protein (isoleucine patch superfamily)